MKLVRINAYKIGLLYVNGTFEKVLQEGAYIVWPWQRLDIYDKNGAFSPSLDLNVLLKDETLAECLHLVIVKDHELALRYENGLLKDVLTPGRYAYWKGIVEYNFVHLDIGKIEITETVDRSMLQGKLLSPYVRTSTVEEYEKAILFIDGKYAGKLESGVYYWWKNHIPVLIGKVDTRQLQLEVNGQEILTRDKATLRINAWLQYKVTDIEKALLENKEYEKQLYTAAQLAAREYIGAITFDELLEKRDSAFPQVLEKLQTVVARMGIEILGFGIRDIVLPGDVKEIMNHVLVAEKKAQANIIMRREETASTRSLLNTAKLMEDNPMLFKLKEMEYVEKIAEKISGISVNGHGDLIAQLKQIFVPQK